MRYQVVPFVLALCMLYGCGGGGGSNSTPTPTPTQTPSALAVSPTSITLSVSGAGGVPQSMAAITVSQQNVPNGNAVTLTTTCYGATPAYIQPPTTISQNNNNGLLTGSWGPINAIAAGTCSFTLTSTTGAVAMIPVTVNP